MEMRAGLGILALLGLMAWSGFWPGSGAPSVKISDGMMSVDSKSQHFEFAVGQSRYYSLHLLDLSETSGLIKKMGFDFHGAMLKPEHFQQFENILSQKRCPAAFLNKHGQNFMLAASTPQVKAALGKLRGRHHGTAIALSGNTLSFASGKTNGIPMQSFHMGGATALLVESIQRQQP